MVQQDRIYLEKAWESLAGAESEYANRRYNNTANRCYYACFQAALHALSEAGFGPTGSRGTWSHEAVQAQFAGELIGRQKRYPAELRDTLARTLLLRTSADYKRDRVSETQAVRALRRSRTFVETIQPRGGQS